MIWEVPGIEVGHWTDPTALTGCTVILCPPGGAVASGEVRGGAPATREFALLDPMASVQRIDAVVLSGGSAFGLAAADGVMDWCEERGRGVPTVAGPVPIVIGMSLFDLGVGDPSVRPGPDEGRAAVTSATADRPGTDRRRLRGDGQQVAWSRRTGVGGGLVGAVLREGDVVVAVLIAVNAIGDVAGHGPAGDPWPDPLPDPEAAALFGAPDGTNTTIGVVATNAALDKLGCLHLARSAHDGLARAITPPHATVDGDAFVALSAPPSSTVPSVGEPVPLDRLKLMVVDVVDRAIRSLAGNVG